MRTVKGPLRSVRSVSPRFGLQPASMGDTPPAARPLTALHPSLAGA